MEMMTAAKVKKSFNAGMKRQGKKWERVGALFVQPFINAMQESISKAMFFGPKDVPPSQPLTIRDVAAAEVIGQPEVMAWIQAISKAIRYQRKPTKKFMDEWRANLWDLEGYLMTGKDNRSIYLPVWGAEPPPINGLQARYNSIPSKNLDALLDVKTSVE